MTDLPEDIREAVEALIEKLLEIRRKKPATFSVCPEFHGTNGIVRATKWKSHERPAYGKRNP